MNKVELYWLSSFIRASPYKGVCSWEAPCLFTPDSPNHVRGLNNLFLGALTCKVRIMCGCLGSRTFSVVERHLEF